MTALSELSCNIFNSPKSGAETTLHIPINPGVDVEWRTLSFILPTKSARLFADPTSTSPSSLFHFEDVDFVCVTPATVSASSSTGCRFAESLWGIEEECKWLKMVQAKENIHRR